MRAVDSCLQSTALPYACGRLGPSSQTAIAASECARSPRNDAPRDTARSRRTMRLPARGKTGTTARRFGCSHRCQAVSACVVERSSRLWLQSGGAWTLKLQQQKHHHKMKKRYNHKKLCKNNFQTSNTILKQNVELKQQEASCSRLKPKFVKTENCHYYRRQTTENIFKSL